MRALRAAGVEVVALKGAALAFFHYPDPALRPMGDLDLLLLDPRDLGRATDAMARAGWRALFDTPRHRVFARSDERVARPASEDPDNPVRVEIHTSFRLPVLGRVFDASADLRREAETRDLGGVPVSIAAGPALLKHLLFHAAEDFAGNGIRGIQAHDFRLLARSSGRLAPEISGIPGVSKTSSNAEESDAAPLLFAAEAIERLFPSTFEEIFLRSLATRSSPSIRANAARLPILRYTRPARGWSRTLLTLIDGPVPKARFLLRTLFPTLGEVRANAAPDAAGLALAVSWVRVLVGRLRRRPGREPRRPPSGPVLRGAIAGAVAMAIFGTVEIWFSELLAWVFHRGAFAPLEGGFALALFLLYPLVGFLLGGAAAAAARAFGLAPEARSMGALVVLAVHGACRTPHLAGGALLLVGALNVILFVPAACGAASSRLAELFAAFTGPWTVSLLLCGPAWIVTDLLAETGRPARALGFAASVAAIAAAAVLSSKRAARRWTFAIGSGAAIAATLAAVSVVGPDPPREGERRNAPPASRGPNVLLVTLDTVRADHLSLYGYSRKTTPHLERFANSATVYERAIAPSNMTLATHASLFTGLAASTHRAHYDAGQPAGRPLGPGIPTLAEIFARRGYEVSSVAGNYGFLGRGFGLDRGFPFVDARPRRSTLGVIAEGTVRGAFRGILCRTLGLWPEADTRARAADEITDLAIGRIENARSLSRPYFLFVNYFDAHERVLVPRPWAGSFSGRGSRPTGTLFDALLREMNGTGRVALAERDRADLVARYDETLSYVDASLDRLLGCAAERDASEDTLIVVASDHGEAWGEHGAIGHGSSTYQEQVRVPLIVRRPRQKTEKVVEEPVALAGLFEVLTGDAAELRVGSPVVSESFPLVPTAEKPGIRGGRALFSEGRKLIRGTGGRVELYDLRSDPGERNDLAASAGAAEVVSRMETLLDGWIAAHPPVRTPETPESREDRERLRSLGYLR